MALGTRKPAGGDDRLAGHEQWEACVVLTGDSFSSSTFAVELGKFQVETVE
ncbi:hypothetical protein AB0C86_11160 [Streptomyces lavendulae]|uniref:hypothetical protein n=1 Tax=Streptomyces lavendulae TaxID=1914 RepID=UPI0033DD0C0F